MKCQILAVPTDPGAIASIITFSPLIIHTHPLHIIPGAQFYRRVAKEIKLITTPPAVRTLCYMPCLVFFGVLIYPSRLSYVIAKYGIEKLPVKMLRGAVGTAWVVPAVSTVHYHGKRAVRCCHKVLANRIRRYIGAGRSPVIKGPCVTCLAINKKIVAVFKSFHDRVIHSHSTGIAAMAQMVYQGSPIVHS